MERANVGAQYAGASRDFYGGPSKGSPMLDQRYENYRAPYSPEYSPSRNPHHPSHANRTEHRDPRYAGYFERNMRGKDRYNIDVGPRPARDTTGLGGLINRLDRSGNTGDILNLFGLPFNTESLDWGREYKGHYDPDTGETIGGGTETSSERQPGLEGGMGGGLQETTGLWQDWKRIFNRTGNEDLANQWVESQQVATYTPGGSYDDDDYGPFVPPSVIEMDLEGIEYDPADEYDYDRKRGYPGYKWGSPPSYAARGGLMSLRR